MRQATTKKNNVRINLSAKIDSSLGLSIAQYAKELQVSKSWIVQQALRQYFERYDEYLVDTRIASIGETISHDTLLNEYHLPH